MKSPVLAAAALAFTLACVPPPIPEPDDDDDTGEGEGEPLPSQLCADTGECALVDADGALCSASSECAEGEACIDVAFADSRCAPVVVDGDCPEGSGPGAQVGFTAEGDGIAFCGRLEDADDRVRCPTPTVQPDCPTTGEPCSFCTGGIFD